MNALVDLQFEPAVEACQMCQNAGTLLRLCATVLLASVAMAGAVCAQPTMLKPQHTLTPAGMRILEQVESDLQRFVDQMERLPGQDRIIPVKINPDPATGYVWIDLGVGFMPRGQTGFDEGLGEKTREVSRELYTYVESEMTFLSIRTRIGGKTMNEWFPPVPVLERIKEERDTNDRSTRHPGV